MLRLATVEDLPQLKLLYAEVIEQMKLDNIEIWDDNYPIPLLEDDIKNKQLFVYDNNGIVSCFALCKEDEGDSFIKWPQQCSYVYLTRFVVTLKFQGLGYGAKAMMALNDYCKDNNYQSIKALVVDYNVPALNFYKRNGFIMGEGIFHLVEDGNEYNEYGLQKMVQ